MKKIEIRAEYRRFRNNFSDKEKRNLNNQIFRHVRELDLASFTNFHIFLPIEKNNEIDTYPIIEIIFSQDKNVVLPLIVGKEIVSCKVKKNFEVRLNHLEIPEPIIYEKIDAKEIDVIFIPMFVADKYGHRVGYGGGYYDRFLSKCRKDSKKIGLSYFRPIEKIDDIYFGDVPMDYCVTPMGIISF